jgi:hypothetical protein
MKKLFTLITALTLVFAVAGCKDDTPTGPTDAELVAEATTALLLTDLNEVTSNLSLPSGGLHDSVVTWSSSDTAVLTDAGVVTRPAVGADNAVITMTATITIGDENDTKDFTVRVIAAVPTLAITIADMLESTVESGTIVEVTGTVIGIVVGGGVQLTDGTGYIYVYNGGAVMFGETPVEIGDNVVVNGAKGTYYGSPQITDVSSITFIDAGNTVPAFVPVLIADLFAEDPYDTTYHSNPVTVTGVLELDGSDIYFIETDANNEAYRVLIYYKSDDAKMTELMALEGKMVSADIFTYGYHDGYKAWRATINSTAVITSADLTDAQQASYEVATIDLGNLSELTADVAVNATTTQGSAITWSTSDAAVITDAGVITRVIGSDVTAVLTASVTVGTATETRDFDVVVRDASYIASGMLIADALLEDDGEALIVEGIVSNIIGNNTVLQDLDGTAIIIYSDSLVSDNGLAIGDQIIVSGTKDTYYGVHQLGSVEVLLIVSSGNDVLTHTDLTVADIVGDIEGYQGHNFVLTGLIVIEVNDGFGYATLGDGLGNNIVLKVSSIPYAETLWAVDDLVDLSVVAWDVYYGNNRVYVYKYPGVTNSSTPDVFFSEYIEGSSNNKAIEIYNPTDADIVLDGYVINYYNNGSSTVTKSFDLAGITLVAGDVYVICTDSYEGPAVCDEIQSYGDEDSVVFFNGDDAMELMKDGVAIDVIGEVGQEGEDGTLWTVGTGATQEYTLVRAPSVYTPNEIFMPSEWVVYPQNTFDYLGSHTVD